MALNLLEAMALFREGGEEKATRVPAKGSEAILTPGRRALELGLNPGGADTSKPTNCYER
jgi:hypothetical protein